LFDISIDVLSTEQPVGTLTMDRSPGHAPAVTRTVALLDFLATRPGEAFSLSELARRLGLQKSTVHAVVTTLAAAGYLARHPVEKTYALGPALVTVGNAAAARPRVDPTEHARVEMRAVSDELGVQCVAAVVVGADLLVVAHTGTREPLRERLDIGQRMPLAPPLGTVFVAWRARAEIDSWLRALQARGSAAERTRARRAVDAVRERGYSIALAADRRRAGASAAGASAPEHAEDVLLELDGSTDCRMTLVAAPVFGDDAQPVMALAAFGLPAPADGSALARTGARLIAAADGVTRAVHGRVPDDAGGPGAS
jgi:DNA-binding IclR family transcriptional regulator